MGQGPGIQLKVALKYAKPPVWRSVQLPLTATFGDLHAAIQALFDFGANRVYEITRQKMITLEPGQDYPVCVALGGNSPVEYPSGDEPEEPEPFDQAAVNTALAGILRS